MRLIARTFQDLSVVLGVDAALKICSVFGGSEIRISRRDSPDMMSIRELVGEEVLGKLIAYAAGDRLYIPMQSSRLHLTLTFYPPTRRAYDLDNALARIKAGLDGLVDVLKVDDKHWTLTIKKGESVGGFVEVHIERPTE